MSLARVSGKRSDARNGSDLNVASASLTGSTGPFTSVKVDAVQFGLVPDVAHAKPGRLVALTVTSDYLWNSSISIVAVVVLSRVPGNWTSGCTELMLLQARDFLVCWGYGDFIDSQEPPRSESHDLSFHFAPIPSTGVSAPAACGSGFLDKGLEGHGFMVKSASSSGFSQSNRIDQIFRSAYLPCQCGPRSQAADGG